MKLLNEEKLNKMAEFINRYIVEHNGASPKFKEILDYMDMTNSVGYRYLMTLKERGRISYSGKGTLSVKGQDEMRVAFTRTPILGAIPCGSEEDEEEYVEGYVAIPSDWVKGESFLLRASGDSMVDIGIESGDLVLIKKTNTAPSGKVVVCLTEKGSTLKRYYKENGRVRLHAENETYEGERRDFYPERLTIQGIAVKVIKDII
ncbi:MAG: repressor LexA [Clostridia bacterium]|nr:repressor LexA [Clostridia bacterium]MBQ9743753.1 repressor LexA [Clostridia bacterium]